MNKSQIKQKIFSMIENMEQNTYLMPDSWTDWIEMTKSDCRYRTYVGGRGANRYIHFEIESPKERYDISVRRESISCDDNDIFAKPISPAKVLQIIESIYKEKHSFIDSAEGIRKIRTEIRDSKAKIKKEKEHMQSLEKRIVDLLALTSLTQTAELEGVDE